MQRSVDWYAALIAQLIGMQRSVVWYVSLDCFLGIAPFFRMYRSNAPDVSLNSFVGIAGLQAALMEVPREDAVQETKGEADGGGGETDGRPVDRPSHGVHGRLAAGASRESSHGVMR